MVPQITDFGISRCFDEKQGCVITSKVMGSMGYVLPEVFSGIITFKSDIYSLSLINHRDMMGKKGYSKVDYV